MQLPRLSTLRAKLGAKEKNKDALAFTPPLIHSLLTPSLTLGPKHSLIPFWSSYASSIFMHIFHTHALLEIINQIAPNI